MNPLVDFQLVRQPLSRRPVGTVPNKNQLGGYFTNHMREHLYHVDDTFYRTEVRQMNEDGLVRFCEFCACFRTNFVVGDRSVYVAVDEVWNDFDRSGNGEI